MGIAVGDDLTGVASPLRVLAWEGVAGSAGRVVEEARRREAGVVVIGLPTNADGAETPACRRSHLLAQELETLGIQVVLEPELLTTDEARRRARESGRPRTAPVDDIAAQVILEQFLAEGRRP